MSNYLNETGLAYLWLKIKATFIKKSDTTAVTSISIDSTPTASSNNLVTSGGVKTALDSKLNTIDSSHKLSADLISDGTTNKAYTATEKTKLSGIASGAEVNVQANWNETNTSSDAYILNKPSIPDDSNLVHKTGDEYIHGTKSFQSDTGHYISIDSNIEKVFSEAPLNYWDWIKITGKGGLNQTLQQALNARDNVQADWNLTTTTAADYIKNKPTIPAAQIQSDWNQTTTTALDYIKNKPTIPAAQIQADWNQTVTTAADYIKNKPSIFKDGIKLIISNPGFIDIHNDDQNIEITAFDDDIKLNAGGKAYYNNNEIATKNDIPTVSTTVTQNDTNPVSGGAVYTKFADLIGSAPAALDTLQEIAAALNNDANLASTLTTQINAKVPKVSNPTTNNFASFNSDGTIKDSGVSASSFITTETQPDWNETTTTSAAYIQNKPNIICYDGYNPNNSISFGPNGIGIDVLGTSNELNLYAPVVCINDFTINDNSEILNSNGENVVLKILNAYSEEYKRILMIEDESEIDDNTLANDIYKVIFYDLELDEISEEYTEKITIGILVHTDNVQYLIKDGVAKYRIYENNNWTEWQNTVKDELSNGYEMSSDSNDDLELEPGDTYEEAFSKLEKAIIDNELVSASALNDLNINSVKKSSTAGLLKNDGTVDTNDYLVEEDVFEDMDANGHDYVDLGLPSGTLWATMNVGASTTSDYGNYYMWGKTTQYDETDTPYNGSERHLGLQNDVASLEWSGSWHIPTEEQITELILYTKYERISGNDYSKYISYEDPTKYIIIPHSGLYSSSQPASTNPTYYGTNGNAFLWSNTNLIEDTSNGNAKFLSIGGSNINYMPRSYGLTIRPVLDGNKVKNQNNLYIKPNWSLTMSSAPDYILNKPSIYNSPAVNTNTAAPIFYFSTSSWYYDSTGTKYQSLNGTTSTIGHATMMLGNATASGVAGNKQGKLVLYSTGIYSNTLNSANLTANRTLSLPNENGTLATLAYVTSHLPATMIASGSNHAGGLVPDPGSTQGTTKYLREDGTWQVPTNTTYSATDFDIKDLTDSTSLRSTWSGKQDALVSGTNIKTINNQSLLGSGNITISGGGGGGSVDTITNNEIDSIWDRIINGIISFTIDNVSYQAGVNMTWAAWVESDYNTGGFSAEDNYIYGSDTYYHIEDVTPNMNIVANESYVLTAETDPE